MSEASWLVTGMFPASIAAPLRSLSRSRCTALPRAPPDPAWSETLACAEEINGYGSSPSRHGPCDPKAYGRSRDLPVLAQGAKPTNKAGRPGAELGAKAGNQGERGSAKHAPVASRARVTQALDRVRKAARQRKKEQFTALLHHVSVDAVRTAFYALKRKAAAGVDGVTWQDYEVQGPHVVTVNR